MSNNYVFAYTNTNLGDDLFLYILCNRYKNKKFFIETSNPNCIKKLNIKNLHPINKDALLFRIERKLFSTSNIKKFYMKLIGGIDTYIQIGGSFFMEENNWKINLKRHNKFLNREIPYYLLGCNFGPYKSNEYIKEWKEQFKNYKDICFRDQKSLELFKDLENVRVSNDIVFSLKKYFNPQAIKKKRVSISVINLESREELNKFEEVYCKKIAEIARNFTEIGYEVVLLSFCKNEGDTIAANKIKNIIDRDVEILEYNGNIETYIKEIMESELLIATRFHAMILGLVYNIPILPLIYSNKMLTVLEDINFKGDIVNIDYIEHLDFELIKNISCNKFDLPKYEDMFKFLDRFMNQNII